MRRFSFAILALLLTASIASAAEIEGVQPAALDQPRVNIHLRRQLKGEPLITAKAGEKTINIQAFLDTGASGMMLSTTTADALGVKRQAAGNDNAVFHDIGVGGGDDFAVSEPLYVFIAPTRAGGEPADASDYPVSVGPIRTQVGPLSAGVMEMLTGGLDVVGMPAIKGHVIVFDPKPVDSFGDTMRAGLFDGKGQIPKTDRHIKLTYTSFARFTTMTPPNAEKPTLADNPLLAVNVSHGGKSSSGVWLLDTGAAASMISSKQAEKLGVKYVPGTKDTNDPKLEGVGEKDQFTFTIGGVGGSHKAAGFFIDKLAVPTRENDPLVYIKAPVLVSDITVEDPKMKEQITLDGVFGMNFLVASAYVTEAGMLPDIGKMSQGPFKWIVIDEPAAELGVTLKGEIRNSKIEIRSSRKKN